MLMDCLLALHENLAKVRHAGIVAAAEEGIRV
jgi:hypothetical protein